MASREIHWTPKLAALRDLVVYALMGASNYTVRDMDGQVSRLIARMCGIRPTQSNLSAVRQVLTKLEAEEVIARDRFDELHGYEVTLIKQLSPDQRAATRNKLASLRAAAQPNTRRTRQD